MNIVRNVLIAFALFMFATASHAESTCVKGATQFNVQAFAVSFHTLAVVVRDNGGMKAVQEVMTPEQLDIATDAVTKMYAFGAKGGKCFALSHDEARGLVTALVIMADWVGKHNLDSVANAQFIKDAGSEANAAKLMGVFDEIGNALADHGGLHHGGGKDMGL